MKMKSRNYLDAIKKYINEGKVYIDIEQSKAIRNDWPYTPPTQPQYNQDWYKDREYRKRNEEDIERQNKIQRTLRDYVERMAQERLATVVEEKEPEPAPTYEERLARVEYSMADIESLFFALSLLINNPVEREAFDTVFKNWKNDHLFKENKKK